mgnify:CR=1 FL=1
MLSLFYSNHIETGSHLYLRFTDLKDQLSFRFGLTHLLLVLLQFSCTKGHPRAPIDHKKVAIKIGTIAGPESELMEVVQKIALREHQLKIEIVNFNDFMTPNIALDEQSIDANAFQHTPYLEETVKARGFEISSIGKTFLYPLAAYSKKLKDISSIKPGSSIAIPNDPSNEGRSLLLLEQQGLITLKSGSGLNATPLDIVNNPKHLKLIELEAAQLPRVLDDVDVAIINTVFAAAADLKPQKDGLFIEDRNSPYANLVVVRSENKNALWTKLLMKSIHHPEVYKAAQKIFNGGALAAWEYKHDKI